jgi:hypothetical protein
MNMGILRDNWIVIAIVAAILIAALCVWWWLPRWQVRKLTLQISDPKARADVEDNFRKTVGQALGAAVLIGAGLAYLQFTQQQQATRDQLQASYAHSCVKALKGKSKTIRQPTSKLHSRRSAGASRDLGGWTWSERISLAPGCSAPTCATPT